MHDFRRPALAIALGLCFLPVRAGGGLILGDLLIPASGLRQPGESGDRAHTSYRIRLRAALGMGPAGGVTPAQVRSFYGVAEDAGHGVIAIVGAYHGPSVLAHFNAFSARFGLPTEPSADPTSAANQVLQVVYAKGKAPDAEQDWASESTMDAQWAHAMAPRAKIVLVEAASAKREHLFQAVDVAAALPGVTQVSMSWGIGERADETAFDGHFQVDGPVFFAAAGDGGGTVLHPAASPYVVAAGGTWVEADAHGALLRETAWRDGGGGTSAYEPKPDFQDGVAHTGPRRGTPDLSCIADSDPGLAAYGFNPATQREEWMIVGGTSCSSPCLAGMLNASGTAYTSTTAFLRNLYQRFRAGEDAGSIRDITAGSNGHPALPGWDFATGLGVPAGPGAF